MVEPNTHIFSPIRPSEEFLGTLEAQYETNRDLALLAFTHTRGEPNINAFYEGDPQKLAANMGRIEDEANAISPELGMDHVRRILGFFPAALRRQKLEELANELVQKKPDEGVVRHCIDYLENDGISEANALAVVSEPVTKVLRERAEFFQTMLGLKSVIANEIAKNGDYDGMTQVFNKVAFERQLNTMIKRNNDSTTVDVDRRHAAGKDDDKNCLAVFMIDLDGFKAINDFIGHAAGDAVLMAVAKILQDTVREGDIVGRLGGDEFALAVKVENAQEAAEIQRRIEELFVDRYIEWRADSSMSHTGKTKDEICEKGFNVIDENGGMKIAVPLRASVGMVMTDLNQDAAHALKAADAFMFEQKQKHHAGDPTLRRG